MTTGYALQDIPNTRQPQFGWPRNRVSGVIGVHTTENITDLDGPDQNAENCLQFLRTRGDHGSYHALADYDSIIPLIHPGWSAWADTTNNAHAMSVSGALQAARWRELTQGRADQIVTNMAVAAANLSLTAFREGYMAQPTPARRISASEAISGSRAGFYGHGETNPGTRYDPGAHFNWDLFLAQYSAAVAGGSLIIVGGSTKQLLFPDSDEFGPGIPDLYAD